MKQAILLPLLFVVTTSFSGISSAFGLAEALKPPTYKTKKDASENKETKKSSGVQSLEKILTDWTNAFNNKDIETLMSFYDKNTILATPDLQVIKGASDVEAWYKGYLSQMTGTLMYMPESISEKGGVGTIIIKFYIEPGANSEVEEGFKGRAMLVLKKKFLGDWLVISTMMHEAP